VPTQAIFHVYLPFGSGSYEALQKNEPAAPSQSNVFVSISAPPLGAVFPSRKSFARPAVGTRSSTENDAKRCVWIVTELDLPLGTLSWKKTLPPAASAPEAAKARTSAPRRQRRTRACYRENAPRETTAKRRP
jgi:hypothetical protein